MMEFAWGAAASAIGFLALWPISLLRRDASVVDLWWGPGFVAFVAAAALAHHFGNRGEGAWGAHGVVAVALMTLWAARLTWTMAARRARAGVEDPRYAELRAAWGAGWWWKSLFLVFALQAAIQSALAAPFAGVALAAPVAPGPLLILGVMVALSGLTVETIADTQLDRWSAANPDTLCVTGLRRLARHPNYAGEIIFWTGLALIGLESGAPWALLTPCLLAGLLGYVSGKPMTEARLARHPGWDAYAAATPAFVPRRAAVLAAISTTAGR
ncbi:MAG: steroid 5-alpha reductase family enzyme [Paracoccaceae bacterium]|jgi:steroid 5-alpha reductase family enzyme